MPEIKAVIFDCYGTLIDFGDESFARAYGEICAAQGIAVEGKAFYDKWMEVWRRLAQTGRTTDTGTVAVETHARHLNEPGPLSEAQDVPPHPEHHTPSAGRNRALEGPLPPFRPYREEWPEHFAICFEELGVAGDAKAAYESLRDILCVAPAFEESARVVDALRGRLPVGVLSNADDDFLNPVLEHNRLSFPLVLSSESTRVYKPHRAVFEALAEALKLPLESILYVGDSRFADIAGAKNAGMLAAWVNRKGAAARPIEASGDGASQRRLPDPDFEVPGLEGLLDIMEGHSG